VLLAALVSSLPIDVMHGAMATHNGIMRKAAWQHYGFVIGQEGDSFIIAFRAALDAVSFCLQVGTRKPMGMHERRVSHIYLFNMCVYHNTADPGGARHIGAVLQ
jgi:class 3 adenylate cyclase